MKQGRDGVEGSLEEDRSDGRLYAEGEYTGRTDKDRARIREAASGERRRICV